MREVAEWYSDGPNASKIIFEGTVEKQEVVAGLIGAPREAMSTSGSDQHRVVYVRVQRSYRGEVRGTVRVLTGNSGERDCGFDFETGGQYLVYAGKDDSENLVTSICTGTSLLEEADLALRILRGEQPSADDLLDGETYYKKFAPRWTGTLCGRVTEADGTPFGEAWVDMMQMRDELFAVNTPRIPTSRKRMAASASGTSVLEDICSVPNGWTLKITSAGLGITRGWRTTRKLSRSKSTAATT